MKTSVSSAHIQTFLTLNALWAGFMVMLSTKSNWHREAVFHKNDIKNKMMD